MHIDHEMSPALQAAIDAGPVGDLTFLRSRVNRPFTKSGFGHWFKACCRDAGLHHHSAHGLRKCAAVRIAHNRGTLEQSKATMGWRENRTPARYQEQANRSLLGDDAPDLLKRPKR